MDGYVIPPELPPRPDPGGHGTDWHGPMLRELAELAMDAARRTHARCVAAVGPDAVAAAQSGLLLIDVVRETIALDARLAAGVRDERGDCARTDRHDHRRADLRRRMVQAIRGSADPESLLDELDERLDDDDIEVALDTLPVARILLDLCDEWGIAPDLAAWTDADSDATGDPDPPER